MAQALAGKYRRRLCILQPTSPDFTDEMLNDAIQSLPSRSIIVIEVRNNKFIQANLFFFYFLEPMCTPQML
jgi:hypothetical protein